MASLILKKILMPFCFLVAEVTILFKAHSTVMELSVKIMLFWHKLTAAYSFTENVCIYKKKYKKAEVVFLLYYLHYVSLLLFELPHNLLTSPLFKMLWSWGLTSTILKREALPCWHEIKHSHILMLCFGFVVVVNSKATFHF